MKTFLLLLLCTTFAAKSQQLPKSDEKSIFGKLQSDEIKTSTPKLHFDFDVMKTFSLTEKRNENLALSTNIFKNRFFSESLQKSQLIKYDMPIVDTRFDNSRMRTFEPDVLFKSKMPMIKTYSYW